MKISTEAFDYKSVSICPSCLWPTTLVVHKDVPNLILYKCLLGIFPIVIDFKEDEVTNFFTLTNMNLVYDLIEQNKQLLSDYWNHKMSDKAFLNNFKEETLCQKVNQ